MKLLAKACGSLLLGFCLSTFAVENTNAPVASVVSFSTGTNLLNAYLFKPETPGPHPVIVWNHGSPKPILQSGPVARFNALAKFFIDHDFVLFIPDRRARTIVFADEGAVDPNDQEAVAAATQTLRDSLDENHADFLSAAAWLKKQSFVKKNRIFVGGYSAGAIQAMYEGSLNSELRGLLLFTPGSVQWSKSAFLRQILLTGASTSRAPIYIAQVQNDAHLQAIAAMGKELAKKGPPNATIVYPPHGKTQPEASLFALTGVNTWGPDVAQFLESAMKD